MNKEEIKKALAPCGLSCEACFARVDGAIQQHALALQEKLGNFSIYAKRFETLVGDPEFKLYPEFKTMLEYFAKASCQGCRKEQCKLFKGCGVRGCHQEKGVDFCYECNAFPCDHTGFDPHLYDRWVALNNQIRDIGLEAYYEKARTRPRYV
jgi:hypothetical protein